MFNGWKVVASSAHTIDYSVYIRVAKWSAKWTQCYYPCPCPMAVQWLFFYALFLISFRISFTHRCTPHLCRILARLHFFTFSLSQFAVRASWIFIAFHFSSFTALSNSSESDPAKNGKCLKEERKKKKRVLSSHRCAKSATWKVWFVFNFMRKWLRQTLYMRMDTE